MNPTLTLVLILGNSPGNDALSAKERRELARHSARWSVEFVPLKSAPSTEIGTQYLPSEPIVAALEALLETARLSLARLDDAEAGTALVEVERTLRAHPELPQAAWLRAEQLTLSAELAERTRAGDPTEMRRHAAALEGPRAAAFRQGQAPAVEASTNPAVASRTLRGIDARDEVEWNGGLVVGAVVTSPGEHAVRVRRRGRTLWAAWVPVAEAQSEVALDVPKVVACSAEDLDAVRVEPLGPSVPQGVTCPDWAVARRSDGHLEVARCRMSECGTWQRLEPEPAAPRRLKEPRVIEEPSRFPTWATVTLAGVGAVLGTSLLLWQVGAFESDSRPRERWVYRPSPE